MDINHSAPVSASAETVIDAPIEQVWQTLVDVERWPDWNPEVKTVTLEGGLRQGSAFRWKTSSGTITSTFQTIEAPHHVAWTGRTMTIDAIHVWRLTEREGGTIVQTAESFEGLVAQLLRRPLRTMLQNTLQRGLQTLRAAVEAQSP